MGSQELTQHGDCKIATENANLPVSGAVKVARQQRTTAAGEGDEQLPERTGQEEGNSWAEKTRKRQVGGSHCFGKTSLSS